MSELFHNLSWQALTSDNDRYQIQFDAISILIQYINQRLQRHVMEHRRKTKDINDKIVFQLKTDQIIPVGGKSEIDKIEQKIIDDIINENEAVYAVP